ncbi:OprD family outer membrane porin [Endozoicomonas sp. SCSIO W0465]|uniref:OprD family outer membrane porin n=1 Tax=Endozoicomonas sp. SCSIO W0465 TaxID=2918516 RepID=UPI0020753C6B|nr:OprD family outer membrane porin [Endozoicomonas sp. SCSIO W0465]USE36151.1 OprD family porin [Endozoicomonas sp. SCSIO W0465]
MSSLRPSLLSCAVVIFSLPVMAIDSSDPFIRDAKIDGKVETIFYNDKNTSDGTTGGAWTGAIWLNAETGYLADVINVGGSAYRVAKLNMKAGNNGSSDLLNADNEGFGKVGQLWVDVKLPKSYDGVSADVKIGRQLMETGLIRYSSSRSVPSSWQGVDAAVSMDNFKGKIAWVDEVSTRTQSGFHHIVNAENEKIDWVVAMQLSYTFDLANHRSLELQYNNGLAHKYVTGQNVNAIFTMPLHNDSTLTLTGMYYHAKQDGDLWKWVNNPKAEDYSPRPFDNKAQSGNLNAVLESGPWTFNAGVTYTKAKTSVVNTENNYQTIGYYDYYFGANTQGAYDVPSNAIYSSFYFDKETAWMVGAEYDFSSVGIDGLSFGYNYMYGSGMKARNIATNTEQDVHESESDLTLIYNFNQPELKGLQFKVEYAYYKNSDAFYLATGQNEVKDLRSWLSYSFSI